MHFAPGDITLYVPCYNPGALLDRVLEGIRRQTIRPARVLLVDDGSSVPLESGGFEVLKHGENLGLAQARNTALAACGTPLIAALDADVVAAPDWLRGLLATLNETGAAGVGGRLVEHAQTQLGDRWRAVHMAQHWGDQRVVNPRFLYGANTLFVTDVLRGAGGYSAELRTNNEDRTVCDALYASGRTLVYEPAALCRHLRRDTAASVLRGYWKWHHAKGLVRGDFDSDVGTLRRIGEVNFGIFRYRYDMDVRAGRPDFLPLDLALPWVFCHLDLEMLSRRTGRKTPDLTAAIAGMAPPLLADFLRYAISVSAASAEVWPEYMAGVAEHIEQSGWRAAAQSAGMPWHVLAEGAALR
jgi:glycosyltransferase involved in cell wall biosynthesis